MSPSTARFEYQLHTADYAVIGGYLLLLVATGVIYRRMVASTRDYFVGGNRISWWLAGMSAFMASFSAWTFTGAAGLAYRNGHVAILYFMGNALGFLFSAAFIAHRVRQTRKMTAVEIVRDRFGRITEQVVALVQLLTVIPMAAVWLTGLALFFSVAFGVPMSLCIVVAGLVITLYSTLGGNWAVTTSDFFQGIMLVLMVVLIAGLSFGAIGGFEGLATRVPEQVRQGFDDQRDVLWLLAGAGMSFLTFSSVMGGARYLSVRDGLSARKVAALAGVLFILGPTLWFLPPIAASYLFPDLGSSLPQLKHPQEGAYLIMGLSLLPHGLAGLLLMNIFGATLSTLDGAMNQMSGVFTLNIYRAWIRPRASERELFVVAHVFSVLFGLIVVAMALVLSGSERHGLLEINLNLQSIMAVPMLVPFVLIFFLRRTPWWSAVVTLGLGILFSATLNKNVFWPDLPFHPEPVIASWFGVADWPAGRPLPFAIRVFATLGACVTVFLASRLLWSRTPAAERERTAAFYATMERPIDLQQETPGGEDYRQFLISGTLLGVSGVGLIVIGLLIVRTDASAWITAGFGAVVAGIGAGLFRFGKGRNRTPVSMPKPLASRHA